jgi:hypothetical protein
MPTDQRIRFDVPQHIAPREHSTQSCHRPPRGIICPSRFNLPLLKESQLLLPKEQILGCKCPARASSDTRRRARSSRTSIAVARQCRRAASNKSGANMKAQDLTFGEVYECSGTAIEFLRSTGIE